MSPGERAAVRADAQARLTELRAVARNLWADREDAEVMSELTGVMGQIRQAESLIKATKP